MNRHNMLRHVANASGLQNRRRVLTKVEREALKYQSQGSFPAGLKNVRSHSLRDVWRHTAGVNPTIQLFQSSTGSTALQDSNLPVAGQVPQGQAMLVHEVRFSLSQPATAGATFDDNYINAWARLMRETVFEFSRLNGDWDAQFLGLEILPPVFGLINTAPESGQAAPVRVGDFVYSDCAFRLRIPVVLGQSTAIMFKAAQRAALLATNPLVVAGGETIVELRGLLTKVAAV